MSYFLFIGTAHARAVHILALAVRHSLLMLGPMLRVRVYSIGADHFSEASLVGFAGERLCLPFRHTVLVCIQDLLRPPWPSSLAWHCMASTNPTELRKTFSWSALE